MTSKRSSTLDQINELLKPCPEIGSDSDGDLDTQAKVADYEFEDGIDLEQPRSIVSQISAFADDPRYTGVKVTRKNVDKSGIRGAYTSRPSGGLSAIIEDTYNIGSESEIDSDDGTSAAKDSVRVGKDFDDDSEVADSAHDDGASSGDDDDDGGDGDGVSDEEESYDEEADSDYEDLDSADDNVSISGNFSKKQRDKGRAENLLDESTSSIQHISSSVDVKSEVEKAIAVKNQLYFWDKILECRIRLQKSLSLSNKFPKYTRFPNFKNKGGSSFSLEVEKVENSCCSLLDKLISLQKKLVNSYSETQDLRLPSVNFRDKNNTQNKEEDIKNNRNAAPSFEGKVSSVDDYESVLSSVHDKYLEFRNATIQKWNDRTRVSSGRARKRDFSAFEQTTLQQIQHVLSNRPRLIQRTRLRGSVGNILGDTGGYESEHDAEIFEDSDFYHQMLKEIIERNSDGSHDATAVGKRWAAIQKLRLKMKRHVDTRATKGRRLRFTPYPKLVGLMAPIYSPTDWDERAACELFNSLFGQKKR